MTRRVVKIGLVLVGFLVAYVAFTFVQVWQTSRRDDARPAEAIVVLGAAQFNGVPSPILKARLDHAVELYEEGLAPYVVVTGGKQPGDAFTEATASANYLITQGVPDEQILREVDGTTSWESLAAASQFLRQRNITEVLLVSDAFHSYRIEAIAEELGLDGHPSPTRSSPITGASEARHLLRETAAVAVGRIVGYRREAGIHRRVQTELNSLPAGCGQSPGVSARCSENRSAGAFPE